MNMGSQQSELVLGTRVKEILESMSGVKYILKAKAELVHPEGTSWYIHLPMDNPTAWIANVRQKGDRIVFKSPLVYDVSNVMEFEHRKAYMKDEISESIPLFHDPAVRRKFSKQIPKVVKFFDSAQEMVADINERYPGSFSLLNDQGYVSIVLTVTESEASNELKLGAKLAAMRELYSKVEKTSH